jgi:murein DD-endopeptidase MepM/ murein hydrolase activator NlpD
MTGGDVRKALLRTSARRPSLPKHAAPSRADIITRGVIDNDELEKLTTTAPARDEDETTGTAEPDEIPAGEGSPKGISFNLIPSEEPFSWPVQGGIVRSPFGMRHGRQHAGIDICAQSGSPIYAARDGVVAYSGHKFRGYGNVVMIDHRDGFTTVYAHNTENIVHEGDPVVRGQMIARVGATGNATGSHCHFEIRNDNVSVDPRGYLSENPDDDVIFAAGGTPQTMTP